MSRVDVVLVEDVTRKTGEKNGRAWTRYSVKDSDGNWYSTFEGGVVNSSMKGQTVELEWEQNGDFRNLLRASGPGAGSEPTSTIAETEKPDWDLIGLRKTRCALWVAVLESPLLAAYVNRWIEVQSGDVGNADIQHVAEQFARRIVLAAEVDIFHREPAGAEEDIPF